jgi:signal transduction histidine kinase
LFPNTPAALLPVVQTATVTHPDFFTLAFADKDGIIFAAHNVLGTTEAERNYAGVNASDRQYYKDLIATRKTVVSDAITGKASPIPTIAIAAPVFDEQKNVTSFVVGGLFLDQLYNLAEAALGSEFAIPVVIDRQGQVIVHPNKAFVEEHRNLAAFEPAKRALVGEEGFVKSFQDADGKMRSAAYVPIPELGWAVWIAQDADQFKGTERRVLVAGIIWGVSTLIGIFVIYLLLSSLFFRPFGKVTEQALEIIEKNDFGRKVEPHGTWQMYELSSITDAFNRLIAKVGGSFQRQEESLKMKTKFLTVATHAFRTPITVLQWTLSSMMQKIDTYKPDQRDEIQDLYEGTQRLNFGFENLFTSLQIQEKTGRLEPKEVKLTSLVNEAVIKLRPIAKRVGVEMSLEGSEHVAALDEGKMRRVIEILISNAIFYNRKGGDVTVSVSRDDGHVVLVVRDSGIGMTEFELEHAYEPFFRGEVAAKKFTDGTGLGLYIAKAFVDLHRGTITVRSKEGRETVVTVRLPVHITFSEEPA